MSLYFLEEKIVTKKLCQLSPKFWTRMTGVNNCASSLTVSLLFATLTEREGGRSGTVSEMSTFFFAILVFIPANSSAASKCPDDSFCWVSSQLFLVWRRNAQCLRSVSQRQRSNTSFGGGFTALFYVILYSYCCDITPWLKLKLKINSQSTQESNTRCLFQFQLLITLSHKS